MICSLLIPIRCFSIALSTHPHLYLCTWQYRFNLILWSSTPHRHPTIPHVCHPICRLASLVPKSGRPKAAHSARPPHLTVGPCGDLRFSRYSKTVYLNVVSTRYRRLDTQVSSENLFTLLVGPLRTQFRVGRKHTPAATAHPKIDMAG